MRFSRFGVGRLHHTAVYRMIDRSIGEVVSKVFGGGASQQTVVQVLHEHQKRSFVFFFSASEHCE